VVRIADCRGDWAIPLLGLGIGLFERVDRLDESRSLAGERTFVNVLLKARKP
jgi:hypothetical protein